MLDLITEYPTMDRLLDNLSTGTLNEMIDCFDLNEFAESLDLNDRDKRRIICYSAFLRLFYIHFEDIYTDEVYHFLDSILDYLL